ncbi:MAG: ice-binding family protein, partial [Acidimicrobiales bacterium]
PTFNLSTNGTVTLDANGDPDAQFIFLTGAGGTTLITGSGSTVLLIDGAQACNVYWQVASSATVGVDSVFVGNILAAQSISLLSGATLQGRALAQNGAVTLDNNTVTAADCQVAPPPTTAPPTTAPPTTAPPTTAPPTTAPPTTAPPTTAPPTTAPVSPLVTSPPGVTVTPVVLSNELVKQVLPVAEDEGGPVAASSALLATPRSAVADQAGDSGRASQAEQAGATGHPAGGLPATGVAIKPMLVVAALAIGFGGLMLSLSLRRRRPAPRRSVPAR